MAIASTTVRHTGEMAADLQSASIQVSTDAASVGDTLVAILFVADLSVTSGDAAQGVTPPAGWTIRNVASMVPTGDPRRLSGVFIVAEKKVTVAGTDAGIFRWSCVQWRPMKLYKTWCQLTDGSLIGTHMQHTASLTVLRFTGVTGILSIIESRLANQLVTYPGQQLQYTAAGHAIVLGGIKQAKQAGTLLPSQFHTQRAAFGPLRYGGLDIPQTGVTQVSIATRDFAGATSLSDFSGTAVGDGYAATILVAQVVKPRVSIITPVSGAADLTRPLSMTWTPQDAPQTQSHVSIYRESPPGSGSNVQAWNGTGWQASLVGVQLTGQQATLPGFAATPGTAYRYLLSVYGPLSPDWADYSVVDLTHRPTPAPPTITLTPAPVSGKVASRVPTLSAAGATTDGGPILGWEAQWVTDAGALLLQSGTSVPWSLLAPLPNDTLVRARVRFVQGGGMWSDWAEVPVKIDVPKPPAPAVTFATVTHPVSGLPLPQLTVTAPAGVTVRVERGGAVIGEVVSEGATVRVVDLAAPAGPVTWQVTTLAPTLFAERSLPAVVTGTTTGAESWLLDPTRPETAVYAKVAELDTVKSDLRSSVFAPIGDPWPIVQPGVPAAPTGGMVLRTDDPADLTKLTDLLKSGTPLVLRGWGEEGGTADARQADITFRPVGEVTEERLAQGPFTYRNISTAFVSVPPIIAGLAVVKGDI